ncbi:MAG: aminotransferase class IV, partial [Chloroflexi bacterium]|nr:aminotransferase class IV [Chloroflexota bacterium]
MSGPDFGPDLVYLNGEIVPSREAVIPAFDYGFLYGFGLFETMRSYKGTIFRLDEHIGRLLDGAAKLGFGSCLSPCEIGGACDSTVQANGLKDARVRLSVTPGNGDGMPDPSSCNKPTVMVTAR